ncbi:hypothetical protein AAFF_G00002040 [Aldrovandia affinis]|uniref:ribonuclease H n=1 Tax=Aldrovandia affinis TaxID=143900 RepID=A0AAD7TD88_9TELE|nr:hypothetical protein AAFF_G00002040 [Aldrovandia affinis]
MSELLRHQDGVAVYMDDVLVYGDTPEEHERKLQCTLKTLEDTGFKLNTDKCLLRQKHLHYFGHCINKHGIRPDEVKVKAITQMQPPKDITDLRRILGMIHYLGRYLPNLSEVMRPLNHCHTTDHESRDVTAPAWRAPGHC